MYTIYDYAYNGYLYLNNIMRPRHKRLSQLMIYSTTACQSRCKHCNIWQKKVEHLSLDDIKNIMASQGDQGSVPLIMLIRFMPMVNKMRNELTKNFC